MVAKRGLSTPDALRLLAKLTGRKPHAFTALGLKDAEATTLQLVCGPCPRGGERRWVVAGGRLWAKVAGYVDGCPRKPKANRFHIVLEPLAGVKASSVVEAAARLKARLPAYYGYQRFGTRRPVTHLLGASLLRGELDTFAATLLGEPHPDESPPTVECRLRAWKGCTGRLLEAKLAPYADRVTDLLRRIPRGLIEIFGGALQAYIFNEYLSARISYGYDLGERLRGERLAADGRPLAPVPGIGYKVGVSGEARTLIREALSAAGLDERDLENRLGLLPKLRPYWRPTYTAARLSCLLGVTRNRTSPAVHSMRVLATKFS
ncbi:MAG: tRNA pseudouridine(13) synthase TruD, partial [Thermoproteota archaeon]